MGTDLIQTLNINIPDEIEELNSLIYRCFESDPLYYWLYENQTKQNQLLRLHLKKHIDMAIGLKKEHGIDSVYLIKKNDKIVCFAILIPPNYYKD